MTIIGPSIGLNVFTTILFGLVFAVAYALYNSSLRHRQLDYFRLSGVPRPAPLWDFDIDRAKPRPYRPFRWAYHQTMSLHKLDHDYWIELESTYYVRLAQRKELYAQHGASILAALPGTHAACIELAQMVIQFLCARYPRLFKLGSDGVFHNRLLGTQTLVSAFTTLSLSDTLTSATGLKALEFLLDNIPEDFLIVQPDPVSGLHLLRGGVACSALGWTLAEKLGKPLHEIHQSVPDYAAKLKPSVDRYFTKLECSKPIQRGAWGLEIGEPLFSPPSNFLQTLRPDARSTTPSIDDISLRVDWQILRRLPVSQTIIFSYRALFTPVTALRTEPYIPRLLARILRDMADGLRAYKGTASVEGSVLPALDKWALEQEEKGWVPRGWEERTLDEAPFFPGWDQARGT